MHSTQKDTTYTKIFVGGLPYHSTDSSLRRYFEVFGEIEEAVVITDRQSGKSRGYGFVTMADQSAADRACKDPNPIIDGRKANVNLAYLGRSPDRCRQGSAMGSPTFIQHFSKGLMGRNNITAGLWTSRVPAQCVFPQAFVQPGVLLPHLQPAASSPAASQYLDYSQCSSYDQYPYAASPATPTYLPTAGYGYAVPPP